MAMKSPSGEILMTRTLVVIVVGPMISKDIAEKHLLCHLEATPPTYASQLNAPKIRLEVN